MARKTKSAKSAKPASGGARLIASGRRPVLLGLTADQHATIETAAKAERRPVTQFLLHHGLAAAEKILGNLSSPP